jgi:hypothetical protein
MSNSLISYSLILAKAMFLASEANPGRCELTTDFFFPAAALTLRFDDFVEEYLRPAIATALEHKHPLVDCAEYECPDGGLDACCLSHNGISGRLVWFYDIRTDEVVNRLSMRVGIADATS